jgi:DNA polymerase III subunit epsilon
MTKLFIVDTETTGTATTDQLCEIAGTLYQIGDDRSQTGAFASVSTLMPITIPNTAEPINGITEQLTQSVWGSSEQYGVHKLSVDLFKEMANSADYCVAFCAEFDALFIDSLIGKQKWICAMKDFQWGYPAKTPYGGYRLIDLALWLGIGISTHHRAGDDVRLLVECLNRYPDRKTLVNRAIVRANSPIIEVQALVSFADRELAKNAGFYWYADWKVWLKKVKECDLEELTQSLSFETRIFTNHQPIK